MNRILSALKAGAYWALLRGFVLFSRSRKLARLARRLYFDAVPRGEYLASSNCPETFIVSSSDRSIGRSVFVNQIPFDFDKMEEVSRLIGGKHQLDLLIDVGSNIGTICVAAVKRGIFRRAVAIEPDPTNFLLLEANVALNALRAQISAHNVALGKADGEKLVFELSEDNFGDHRVHSGDAGGLLDEGTRQTVTVSSETFDSLVEITDPQSTLIWIDVQGYEGYVLAGARMALAKRVPLCLEFWPYGMKRSGSFQPLKNALVDNGYKSVYVLGESGGPLPLSHQTLDDLFTSIIGENDLANRDLLII